VNLNSIVQQLQAERQAQASGVSAKAVTGKAAAANSSAAGDTGDATITADDFLTLLVTELQNQDPTSDTDPNAYVNQLVDVNSLQQLISINSGIGTLNSSVDAPATSDSPSGNVVSGTSGASSATPRVSQAQVNTAQASYGAFDPSPASSPIGLTDQLTLAQQLDTSNPVLNSNNANANPGVPSEWRATQAVTS
jgi:flagellar basal-body rod modification protein FlgD